jgi:hypothetical protein
VPHLLTPAMASKLLLTIVLVACTSACGARSTIGAPELDAGSAPSDAASERVCPPECYAGHECCAGSCDGPAVPMPSDCCTCLPGEVSSWACGHLCPGS